MSSSRENIEKVGRIFPASLESGEGQSLTAEQYLSELRRLDDLGDALGMVRFAKNYYNAVQSQFNEEQAETVAALMDWAWTIVGKPDVT